MHNFHPNKTIFQFIFQNISHKNENFCKRTCYKKKIHPKNPMYKLQPESNLIYDIFSNLHLCLQLIDCLIPRFIQNCHLVRIYTKTRTFIIQTIQAIISKFFRCILERAFTSSSFVSKANPLIIVTQFLFFLIQQQYFCR